MILRTTPYTFFMAAFSWNPMDNSTHTLPDSNPSYEEYTLEILGMSPWFLMM